MYIGRRGKNNTSKKKKEKKGLGDHQAKKQLLVQRPSLMIFLTLIDGLRVIYLMLCKKSLHNES